MYEFKQIRLEEERRHRSLSKKMIFAGWALAFLALTLFIDSVIIAEPEDPRITQTSDHEWPVILPVSRAGVYRAYGTVDGVAVEYVVDTGAVVVALSQEVAAQAGLAKGAEVKISTANGTVPGWVTRIETIDIGPISIHGVDAVVLDNLAGADVLLGMNALKGLDIVHTKGLLKMRPAP